MSRTLRELLQDPAFRRMFSTPPRMAANMAHGTPYTVWIAAEPKRWRKVEMARYADAYRLARHLLGEHVAVVRNRAVLVPPAYDVAISNRRVLIAPPADVTWTPSEGWCSRCRRPAVFRRYSRHHALTHEVYAEGLDPDELRCPYCGIRQAAMPVYYREA